jgi:2-polyprenyl-3-methyl-5-hydroxy-6-metoxy-1,4-benzoquinol methylase
MKNSKTELNKIKLNLFELKPIEDLLKIAKFYKKFLGNFFSDHAVPYKKYFVESNCPICNKYNDDIKFINEMFTYVECSKCFAIYNNPVLKQAILSKMYKSGEYLNYFKTFVAKNQKVRKGILDKRKAKQINSLFLKPGLLLDVGCGSGSLMKNCKDLGWCVDGIEPSLEACSAAKEMYDLNLRQVEFDSFVSKQKHYDCIVFIGLEHIPRPYDSLKKAEKLLKENGIIFIEAPSADSLLMNYISENEDQILTRFIEPGRHSLFFSQKTFDYIQKKLGMKRIFLETNGLDLQTVLMKRFDVKTENKIINIQNTLNNMNLGDHYRIALKKI